MDSSTTSNHSSTASVGQDATVGNSQSQSLRSAALSAQAAFQNTGHITAGHDVKINFTAIANPGFDRFRDKDIGEETSRLYCRYLEKYLPNSRDTEYNKINAWITKSKPIAWIHGGPGIGKSTLSHHLVFKLWESKHLATFGFFKRGFSPMMNLNNVIEHMAYELGCCQQDVLPYLPAVNPPSGDLSVRLNTLIITPLSKLPPNEPKVIIFDALDECSRPQDLLNAIRKTLDGITSNVKFLITSRSGGEIERIIKEMEDKVYSLNMSLAKSSTMKYFFNHRLKDVQDLQKYMDDLMNRAGGLFIWADTICTFVTSPNNGDSSELLKIVLSPQDSPHPTEKQLDDLYSTALNHLVPPTNQLARDNFKAIFNVIYIALGPLNEQALKELVGKGPGGIVSSLRSLQTRPSNDDRVAPATDLFHASFLDFIVSKDRCDDVDFRIEPLEAHKKVATLCIELLSKTFKNSGSAPCAELSAAVRYAIGNWTSHAAECISKLDGPDIPSAWQTFLGTHGDRWGELLLSLIADAVPVGKNLQGKGDDLLSWLNAEFLQLYRKKPLGGHLRKMLHINQVIVYFRREGQVSAQRQLTLLFGNLFKYNDILTNWTEAISLWPRENSCLVSSLTSLASVFYFQFLSQGSISDLDGAISLSQAARSFQPAGHITLNNLAIYLLAKFEETGCEKDLEDSVDLQQMVVKIPPPRFDRAWSLNNLASSLRSRFEQSGSKKDLKKAIKLHEKALRLLSSDPDRPILLGNLALCFETRFENDRLLETWQKAISLHEQALGERNSCHPDYPRRLVFLARSLERRGKYLESQDDLDRAISLSQKALDLLPFRPNDSQSTVQVGDLAEMHCPEARMRKELEAFPSDCTPKAEISPESGLERSGIQSQFKAIASTQTTAIPMQRGLQNKAEDIALLPPARLVRWTGHCTDRLVCLTTLASSLETRSKQNVSLRDVDAAISLRRDALQLRPAPYKDCAWFLSCLACSLSTRFKHSGSCPDIDEAISLSRKALNLRTAPHEDRALPLSNLAYFLSDRFKHSGSFPDIDEAISLGREALELRPPPHKDRVWYLTRLAYFLTKRFEQSGLSQGIDEAISLGREALELQPTPYMDHALYMLKLAHSLRSRFTHSGSSPDIDEAISLSREALNLRPAPHEDRALSLSNLAYFLSDRFKHSGSFPDIDEAISLGRESLELQPTPYMDHALYMLKLAHSLRSRFTHSGSSPDIDEAISLSREALNLRPAPHEDRALSLSNLAYFLSDRFKHSGSFPDIDEAISLGREALELRPPPHKDRVCYLTRLAYFLTKRFEQSGLSQGIDEAISLGRESLELQPTPYMDHALYMLKLAHSLRSRFTHSGSSPDIDEAISLGREALELRPAPHKDRVWYLSGLAYSLRSRFEQSGLSQDIDEAVSLHREALELQPAPHPGRVKLLNALAFDIQCRYEQIGSQDGLHEAISLLQEALKQRPSTHLSRRDSLTNLANCLRLQFMQTKAMTQLILAISLHRKALQVWSSSQPWRSSSLHGLAVCLRCCSAQDTLEAVISLHQQALRSPTIPRSLRFIVLCDLAECLQFCFDQTMIQGDLAEAIVLYREALRLLPVSHFRHPPSLRKLRAILQCRFDMTHTQEDQDEIQMIGQILDDDVTTVNEAAQVE